MGKKLIVILGITGTQGSSVATTFSNHNDWSIRGITRNAGSAKAKAWTQKGAEIVEGDQNDTESLKRAFIGANAIFAVTDYFGNYTTVAEDKGLQEKAKAVGRTNDEYAADREETQGLNIANAAADEEVLATLEKFVFSTLAPVKALSGGKYTHAYEFDSKANVENHIRKNLPRLAERLSTVNMGIYHETWNMIPAFSPHKESDGSYYFMQLNWPGNFQKFPYVMASKDTGVFVEALVLHHPPKTNVLGASEIIDRPDYASLWGHVMGVKALAKGVSEEEYAKYCPEELRLTLIDLYKFFVEYGYAGGNPDVKTPAELNIKPTPLKEIFKNDDWSSVM